jgi:hypothetical protein
LLLGKTNIFSWLKFYLSTKPFSISWLNHYLSSIVHTQENLKDDIEGNDYHHEGITKKMHLGLNGTSKQF